MIFQNRQQAGKLLAEKVKQLLKDDKDTFVLGLPRGGVVIAYEIAKVLNAKLNVIICRKIGAPGNEEFAIGAVSEANGLFLNQDIIDSYGISQQYLQTIIQQEQEKIKTYQKEFRQGDPLPSLKDKKIILADDGAATGMTLKAAITAVSRQTPQKIIVTLPVAPFNTIQELKKLADEVIVLSSPEPFWAVGNFYEDFRQIETDEVKVLLQKRKLNHSHPPV
jgi:predicted phosphoribosyltransferase